MSGFKMWTIKNSMTFVTSYIFITFMTTIFVPYLSLHNVVLLLEAFDNLHEILLYFINLMENEQILLHTTQVINN